VNENTESEKPAYMLASVNVVKPDEMGPYMQKCGPMFEAAGIEVVALGVGSGLQLLEGEWPYEGSLMLYKCGSMDSLLQFWNSPEYQEAIKLREGIVESNFTVAIETTG
jgi:uncharacterized protein (DUF1330 family)